MIRPLDDLAMAMKFMTRVPIPMKYLDPARLSRASAWFPVVGIFVGGSAALCHLLVAPHLERPVAAVITVLLVVMITGGLPTPGSCERSGATCMHIHPRMRVAARLTTDLSL